MGLLAGRLQQLAGSREVSERVDEVGAVPVDVGDDRVAGRADALQHGQAVSELVGRVRAEHEGPLTEHAVRPVGRAGQPPEDGLVQVGACPHGGQVADRPAARPSPWSRARSARRRLLPWPRPGRRGQSRGRRGRGRDRPARPPGPWSRRSAPRCHARPLPDLAVGVSSRGVGARVTGLRCRRGGAGRRRGRGRVRARGRGGEAGSPRRQPPPGRLRPVRAPLQRPPQTQ